MFSFTKQIAAFSKLDQSIINHIKSNFVYYFYIHKIVSLQTNIEIENSIGVTIKILLNFYTLLNTLSYERLCLKHPTVTWIWMEWPIFEVHIFQPYKEYFGTRFRYLYFIHWDFLWNLWKCNHPRKNAC